MGLILLTILLAVGSPAADDPKKGIIGTWEFVSAKVIRSDGKVDEYSNLDLRSHKILNADYFCVVTRNADGSFRHTNLGPYRVEGDIYIETLEYSTNSTWTGRRPEYKFTLEDDLWTIRSIGNLSEIREEVWRRVTGSHKDFQF